MPRDGDEIGLLWDLLLGLLELFVTYMKQHCYDITITLKWCGIGSSVAVFEGLDIDHHIGHGLLLGLLPDVSLLLPKLGVRDMIADGEDDFSEHTHNVSISKGIDRMRHNIHTLCVTPVGLYQLAMKFPHPLDQYFGPVLCAYKSILFA